MGSLFASTQAALPDAHSFLTPTSLLLKGHNIVPATIPTGTTLYHGRTDDHVPEGPDWLAFDFEHAHLFSSGPCYMVSFQAKRDLRLLYFDGSSAAKMKDGTLDSQDVVTWGEPRPDKYISERERIKALCDWGMPLGLDGFVRMQFHLCVFFCRQLRCHFGSRLITLCTARSCYVIFCMA
jgi:hypothetical protein